MNPREIAPSLRLPLGKLPDPLPVSLPSRARGEAPIAVTIRPPGSKSLTNRALLLAALARGESKIRNPLLDADDTERMIEAIVALGAHVDRSADSGGVLSVRGVEGRWTTPAGRDPNSRIENRLELGNAGTATRFLAASMLLADSAVTLDGTERMRMRPIGELVDALASLGATTEFLGTPGCPPLRVTPPADNIPTTSMLEIAPTMSSQFISALLMIGGHLPSGLTLKLTPPITSRSYVEMTLGLLAHLGAPARATADLSVLRVDTAPGAFDLEIEPDASGATSFHGAGALLPDATIRVVGLPPEDSLQGDASFPAILERAGCTLALRAGPRGHTIATRGAGELSPVMVDMADLPDAVMALAVVCSFAPGTSIIRGVRTLRVKETDRIAALVTELGKIGVVVTPDLAGDPDALSITPPPSGVDCSPAAAPVEFDTYDDHRMAMSLALVGLRRPNVFVRDPGCVSKTYPGFWSDYATLFPGP